MNQTFLDKVGHNAEVAFRSGSTYVFLGIAALVGIWVKLSEAQQEALISSLPILEGWTPVISAVAAYLFTRLKPTSAVSEQTKARMAETQALIAEIGRLRLNMRLRAAGAAEIPAPPEVEAVLAVTPVIAVVPPAVPVTEILPKGDFVNVTTDFHGPEARSAYGVPIPERGQPPPPTPSEPALDDRSGDEKWLKALRALKASEDSIARISGVVELQRAKAP